MRQVVHLCGVVCLGLYRQFVRARDKAFSLAVSGAFGAFGRRTVIQLPVRVVGEGQIRLGSGVFVGSNSWLQALGEGKLEIGDGSSFAGGCVISAATSVRLGSKVLLARNVYVSDHMHAYSDARTAVLDQGLTHLDPVEICDGAWLGENVVVCPGVKIGRGAVIGANAVVREDVPDHAVAVGIPAHVVSRFAPIAAPAPV
jgi:acetyltransferase-like isoleucine patch superfamily enzyme